MKQTAVEWLLETAYKRELTLKDWIQAKEMETSQLNETWDSAIDTHELRGHVIALSTCDFDDYYKENFMPNEK